MKLILSLLLFSTSASATTQVAFNDLPYEKSKVICVSLAQSAFGNKVISNPVPSRARKDLARCNFSIVRLKQGLMGDTYLIHSGVFIGNPANGRSKVEHVNNDHEYALDELPEYYEAIRP